MKKSGASAAGDDRKLQTALKKMNVQPVTGVEEVNMFKEDGNVLHFGRPTGEFRSKSRSRSGSGSTIGSGPARWVDVGNGTGLAIDRVARSSYHHDIPPTLCTGN